MRIRGWGRELNRVQKERVVGRPQMGVHYHNHTVASAFATIKTTFITTAPGEPAERLSFQGTVEEWKALRDQITEILKFAGAE